MPTAFSEKSPRSDYFIVRLCLSTENYFVLTHMQKAAEEKNALQRMIPPLLFWQDIRPETLMQEFHISEGHALRLMALGRTLDIWQLSKISTVLARQDKATRHTVANMLRNGASADEVLNIVFKQS
jgi:hypothetical protein